MTNSDIFKKWFSKFSIGKNLNTSLVFYFKKHPKHPSYDNIYYKFHVSEQRLIECYVEIIEFINDGYCYQTIYDGLEITMYYKNCINVSAYKDSVNFVKNKNILKDYANDGFTKMYCPEKDMETVFKYSTFCDDSVELISERLENVESKTIELETEFYGMYNFDGSKMGFIVPVELYKIKELEYKFKQSFKVKKDADMRLYSIKKNASLISHLYRGPEVISVYNGLNMNTDKFISK